MKIRHIVLLILVLALVAVSAFAAEDVVGKWSGTLKVDGASYKASVTFREDGTFKAKANGLTGEGDWSLSGKTVSMSALGQTIDMRLRTASRKQTLSGAAEALGMKGSLTLTRAVNAAAGTQSGSEPMAAPTIYGEWAQERDGVSYTLRVYESGWLSWTEGRDESVQEKLTGLLGDVLAGTDLKTAATTAVTQSASVYGARIEKIGGDGLLTLAPLEPTRLFGPAAWTNCLDAETGLWTLPFELSPDGNALNLLKDEAGAWAFTFTLEEKTLDAKPIEGVLRPYIALQRGDKGLAVRKMQEKLIEKGVLNGEADGDFGPITQKAVMAFEEANGFEPDGVADKGMMLKLMLG